jgi:cardiolipin synthase
MDGVELGVTIAATALLTVLLALAFVNFAVGEKRIERRVKRLYSVSHPQFRHAMSLLLGPPIVGGNRVDTLVNGDRIFPAMLREIRNAKKTITFETFVYWQGQIGQQFADALCERARAGVRVHVLLDWVGSKRMQPHILKQLYDSPIQVERYHPLHWYHLGRLNNRTHRKLLVVDGRVGFTGGVGIAQEWTGDAQDPDHWRDSHYRVEGPVVAQMQATFLDNWMKVRREVLHGPDYFPDLQPAGDVEAQMFKSSAGGGSESMHLMYLLAITAAERSIMIANAYFVPDKLSRDALKAAVRRGVRVQVITPVRHSDTPIVRAASRALWGSLLRAGVEIYEYRPTMFHCKSMIVDEHWVAVGSANFDSRSFSLNDEANLCVFDREFAREQVQVYHRDLERCTRITYRHWLRRPLGMQIRDRAAAWFRSQL